MKPYPYSLLDAIGIELEYMIVDRETLDVRPICDELLHAVAGEYVSDVENGAIAWSNELVLHVVELKTHGPVAGFSGLSGLSGKFQQNIVEINSQLAAFGAMLMPTAMHPWMDPYREMHLWPHDSNEIYDAFNRIFDCRGHGWANLQSTHINLSFGTTQEFRRLHAAIRFVLPVLPAIAASSPFMDGVATGRMDNRVEVYRHNSAKIPSITGAVIPETARSRREYEANILHPIYRDIEPYDQAGILRHEWANARGSIARFDRGSIEIRVLDIQECPRADLAIAGAVVALVQQLCDETHVDLEWLESWNIADLSRIFLDCVAFGDRAVIDNDEYWRALGGRPSGARTAADFWRTAAVPFALSERDSFEQLLEHGCLARRMMSAAGIAPKHRETPFFGNIEPVDRAILSEIAAELCTCLNEGRMFVPT